jgi:hypothetical protein
MSSKKVTDFFSKRQNPASHGNNDTASASTSSSTCESQPIVIVGSEQFHPPEHFVFPKSTNGKQHRSCQHHWFKKFTWLHYDIQTNSVLCFVCVNAEKNSQLISETNKDLAYISKGFRSWKKHRNVLLSMNNLKVT